jgi:hypothetical protein
MMARDDAFAKKFHTENRRINRDNKALPEAASAGHASLMRPKGPLPGVLFVGYRYAVARTLSRRSLRRDWPGGVMSFSSMVFPSRQARPKKR